MLSAMKLTTPLLAWPHEVPAPVMHTLADAHFVRGMELGPRQWWQQWQKERLAELLAWLGAKEWWQAWATSRPGPNSPIEALSGLPIMRREDFRALIASHAPEAPAEHGRHSTCSTSGSSGVPATFWRTEVALRINSNHYWADHQRQGRDLSQRMAVISAYVNAHDETHQLVPGEAWLQPGCQLTRLISQFTIEENARWLSDNRAAYLATRPDVLSGMLSTIEKLGIKAPHIRQIMTYGQTVNPQLRERTRHVLGASIRDRYSCEEVGPLAFQCPESDDYYHCAVTNVVMEVLDSQGRPVADGAQGNVLVTGLHQWASPALRYDLGDIATWHAACPGCGNTVPALSRLMGRKYFLLQDSDGAWRHIRILAEDWLACAPFREYRLIQRNAMTFRAELVLDHPITPAQSQSTVAMLQKLVGPEYTFELLQLNAIPWPPGRKRQEFVGLMP
jgi:phenylacetate-CoA ligase